jgi:RNA polymerase sigma factor (sigma-70 family)
VADRRFGDAIRQVDSLFLGGTTGGTTDGQLLERYAGEPGEPAERAFAVLVERHGPMVLRACRSLIRDDELARDAAQATFLVLARRAGSIRGRETIAPWLYGVARRVALRARSDIARRRRHEQAATRDGRVDVVVEDGREDLVPIIHEELGRLPERYLAPIVLCHLEGLTHEQAAQRLEWPVGTVRSRLARGRDRLRAGLTRRGLAPAGGFLAALAADPDPAGAAPLISEGWKAGTVPATLAREVLRTMLMTRFKLIGTLCLSAALLASGAGFVARRASGFQQPDPPPKPGPRAVDPVAGRQLDELRAERLLAARRLYDSSFARYRNGRTEYHEPLAASEYVLRSEIAVANAQGTPEKSREGRLAAAKAQLERIKMFAEIARARREAARSTIAAEEAAAFWRIDAEILIAESSPESAPPMP